ncbi:MAG: diguanylate cyclase [Candidatus Cloacimonetes bacterium]|nr:diguanylate cyclase [Candidatus Cloacimonadota bacterium]
MKFKLIKFDELLNDLRLNDTLEENLSKIVRDIESEFEYSSLGFFFKSSNSVKFRLKIGRNISHSYMKSSFFTSEDKLIEELGSKRMLEFKDSSEFKFERDYSHLLVQPISFRGVLLAFIFIEKAEGEFTDEEKTKFDIFSSVSSLIIKIFEQEKLIEDMRIYDPVTELYSSRAFIKRAQEVLEHMKRYNRCLTLVQSSIEKYNEIVRIFGKHKVEAMIKEISQVIKMNVRNTEVLGSISDQNIAIAFPETDLEKAMKVIKRLDESITKIPEMQGRKLLWGVTTLEAGIKDIEEMLKQTEEAIFDANRKGVSISIFQE